MSSIPPKRIETGIGAFTDKILNVVIEKVDSPQFRNQINQRLVEPVIANSMARFRPYIMTVCIAYIILLVLIIFIIYLLFRMKKSLKISFQ